MSYQGKYSARNSGGRHGRNRGRGRRRALTLLLSLALLCSAVVGTLAYLTTQTEPIQNTFTTSEVTNNIVEEFDGTTKTSIKVENTGDIDAYIRVKLVTYRVNDQGQRIGGTAVIPEFTPANGWFKVGDHYYYPTAVSANESTENLLPEGGIKLMQYADADGGKQVIEVMAESIQSVPTTTVENVWKVVSVNESGVLTIKGGNA